jgi:hypothetical protein
MLQRVQNTPSGMVISRSTSYLVYDPMKGGEQFSNCRWADWHSIGNHIHITELQDVLRSKEITTLCDMHVTHMFWWMKVPEGAVLFAKPYQQGIQGNRLLYPGETSRSRGMVILPSADKNALV